MSNEKTKIPNNETTNQKSVDLENKNPVEAGFAAPSDGNDEFIKAYFDGPYETAFRRRSHRSAEAPDGKTLAELVAKVRKD